MRDEDAQPEDDAFGDPPKESVEQTPAERSEAEENVTEPTAAPHVEAQIAELEGKNREDLDELARQRSLSGFSDLTKPELVKALTKDLRQNPPPEPRIG